MSPVRFLRSQVVAFFSLSAVVLLAGPSGEGQGKPPVPKAIVPKRVELAKNVFLEVEGDKRRVIVKSTVVLREGQLEGLLTRANAKEHEYILAADCDARHIHTALIAAGAKPGSPVVLFPAYKAATGPKIKVSLRYQKAGKLVTVPAQSWVREHKSKKAMELDWIFGGSRFVDHPDGPAKPKIYVANHGDLICLCNIDTAMLDLPIESPKKFDARLYEAHTERIPPKDTPVELILELAAKK
jgi:hypothetical protein